MRDDDERVGGLPGTLFLAALAFIVCWLMSGYDPT